jgi:ribosomal protein L5
MINSIERLKNLCEIMISMGFSQAVNDKEIKELILRLETIISEEMKLLRERESSSEWK